MNGSHLAIGVAAALAAVGALSRRGSQASGPKKIWRRANQEGSAGEDHDLRRRFWKSMMMGGDL